MSGNQAWETPWELFNPLDAHFAFTLDAAADESNVKCSAWIGIDSDAFTCEPVAEVIWLNPPYADVLPWAQLAIRWALAGNTVVLLLQDRTDTAWFRLLHAHCTPGPVWLTPRVNFVGTVTGNNRGAVVFVLTPDSVAQPSAVKTSRLWYWQRDRWGEG